MTLSVAVQLAKIRRHTRGAVAAGLAEEPGPIVDFKRGRPVLPTDQPVEQPPLSVIGPHGTSLPSSPFSSELSPVTRFVPDTLQLIGGLRDLEAELKDVCIDLDYKLLTDSYLEAEFCSTPFLTPLQRFVETPRCSTRHTFPSVVFPSSSNLDYTSPDDYEADYGDTIEDMAGLQLAVVGSSGRWDGSQGPSYWRRKPQMREAIAGQLRGRGGHMQAADQLCTLENLIEPASGAAVWLTRLIEHLRPEIAAASRDLFPSATLTDELAAVALGHHVTSAEYITALRESLAKALPLAAITLASDYTPSRASGTLVPVSRTTVMVQSETDRVMRDELLQMVSVSRADLDSCDSAVKKQQSKVDALEAQVAEATERLLDAASSSSAARLDSNGDGDGDGDGSGGVQAAKDATTAEAVGSGPVHALLQQSLTLLEEDLAKAMSRLEELSKQRRSAFATHLQTMQQLKAIEMPVQPRAATVETVKAFLHPEYSRLCTAHDCILLKVFAIMDVVYGISTTLQQVKFSELKQGKGVGVSAEESVSEFSARIAMHVQSSLTMDPDLALVQFFDGLHDSTLASAAKETLERDSTKVMNLHTATELVMLMETRQLQNLKLQATNGNAAAAAELKRRASMGNKKTIKDTKPEPPAPKPTKAQREYHPDPNHPEGKCRLPGHGKGQGHSNRECYKGGLVNPAYATPMAANAIVGPVPYNAYFNADTKPHALMPDPMVAVLQQLANALSISQKGRTQSPAKTHPTAAGHKCTICGFPSGHPNGFCYYEYPEKSPTWTPTTNAKPELIELWSLRRQQRNLPPLAPRQVPPRYQPAANFVYPRQQPAAGFSYPTAPHVPLPPPPAYPALPAPLDPMVNVAQYNNTGGVPTLSAVAKLDLSQFNRTASAVAGAVMPRSFLQLPHPSTSALPHQPYAADMSAADDAPEGADAVEGVSAGGVGGEHRGANRAGYDRGLAKRLRFSDELDMRNAIQAPSLTEVEAMMAEMEYAQQVPCLDTFINNSAATGISMQLSDGRWQMPSKAITDSGATCGVTFEASCKGVGLAYSECGVTLVLADGSSVRILGMTDAVKLVLARGTPFERTIVYRFLVLPGEGKHYNWLIAKNALLELGAFVDPAESAFFYRVRAGSDSSKHSVPVRCSVDIDQADPADCLHMLQPVVATLWTEQEPAAEAAGCLCV